MGLSTKMWLQLCLLAGLSGSACQDPQSPDAASRPGGLRFIDEIVARDSTSIRLRLVRFAQGTGEVLVSSGIPLPPGLLREGDLRNVAIEIDDQSIPMYVGALHGRHPDGSLRSILIQFRYAVLPGPGFQVMMSVGKGATRPQSDPALVTPGLGLNNPLPEAVALPTSPSYLSSTRIVGETTPSPSSFSSKWETNFVTYGDPKWNTMFAEYPAISADNAVGYNFYDRAFFNYAWWVRTADVEYWKRAAYYLMAYRDIYAKPNDYKAQPHIIQIEGLEAHYLLTGDAESYNAVSQFGENMMGPWLPVLSQVNIEWNEHRISARILDIALTSYRLGATGRDFAADARQALTAILNSQSADGGYRAAGHCYKDTPFMDGILNEVMIKYYTYFEQDARIPVAIKKNLDFLWNQQWLPASQSFNYLEGDCPGNGGAGPAPDLNLMIANGYAWYSRFSGDTTYRTKGDQIFHSGVTKAWLDGQKQYNENYVFSFRYLAYRS
jgi:hypothetical protein